MWYKWGNSYEEISKTKSGLGMEKQRTLELLVSCIKVVSPKLKLECQRFIPRWLVSESYCHLYPGILFHSELRLRRVDQSQEQLFTWSNYKTRPQALCSKKEAISPLLYSHIFSLSLSFFFLPLVFRKWTSVS